MEHVYISSMDNGKHSLSLHLLELAVAKGDTINFDIYGYQSRYVPERTCNMTLKKSGPYYDVWYFDCCNKEWSEARCDNGVSDYPGIVCPYCGAKVVGE